MGVAKDQIPVKDIKIMIKELEAASMRSSDKIIEASKRFVVAAEEAATNYYVYPTFYPLAYDDTYEHMANHVETFLSLQKLTKACEEEGIAITVPSLEDPGEDVTKKIEFTVPEDAIVKNLYEANIIIEKYDEMSPIRRLERRLDRVNHIMELIRTIVPIALLILNCIILAKIFNLI